jgi:seryl-tRNA synthetase
VKIMLPILRTNVVSTESTSDEYTTLLAKRDRITQTISHIMVRIKAMYTEVESDNLNRIERIRKLLKESDELQKELQNASKKVAEDYEKEHNQREYDSSQDYNSASDLIDDIDEALSEENPKLIKLFKKIAFKTHPDRTDDPNLHVLFVAAKECRNKGDLAGLQEIWDFVSGKVSKLSSELTRKIKEIQDAIVYLELQLDRLRQGEDYQLMTLFERDSKVVLAQFRKSYDAKYKSLYEHVERLKRVLGKTYIVETPSTSHMTFIE